jgi:hypothetical protein
MESQNPPDTDLTLEALDSDGVICEALDAIYGSSRAQFLRRAAIGGVGLLAALAIPPEGGAATSRNDVSILNFDLTFEYLQSSFYTETECVGTISRMNDARAFWARTLGAHERAHVRILKTVLGREAGKKPVFNFRGVTDSEDEFIRTAVAMEDLTVALLAGQTPRFRSRALTSAVFTLLTVEARHAAWARHIIGVRPVGPTFDEPKTFAEVARIVEATRFLARFPRTTEHKTPRFTG